MKLNEKTEDLSLCEEIVGKYLIAFGKFKFDFVYSPPLSKIFGAPLFWNI